MNSRVRPRRARIDYEIEVGGDVDSVEPHCVIVVAGDFSGRAAQRPPLAQRQRIEVNRENFDAVMKRYGVRTRFQPRDLLPEADESGIEVDIAFESLDDFGPEAVIQSVPRLRNLFEKREGVAELFRVMSDALDDELHAIIHNEQSALDNVASLLAGAEAEQDIVARWQELAAEFSAGVANGDVLQLPDVETALSARLSDLDRQIAEQLDEIMHEPEFQQLESIWRGLRFLIDRVTSDHVKVRIFDATADELLRDFERKSHITKSALYKRLYDDDFAVFGGMPATLLIGVYSFDRSSRDLELLQEMGELGRTLRMPFVAAAGPGLLNLDSFAELNLPRDLGKIFEGYDYAKWHSLRQLQVSRHVVLALPRFLLRAPYRSSDRIQKRFSYNECRGSPTHDDYLWGNPALAIGVTVGRAFSAHGWFGAIEGIGSGGLIEDCAGVGPDLRLPHLTGLTELAISDSRVKELTRLGLAPLKQWRGTNRIVFDTVPTVHKPGAWMTSEAERAAEMDSRLNVVLIGARFGQCIELMIRDWVGRIESVRELSRILNNWLANFVLKSEDASIDLVTKKPLRDGLVDVRAVPGSSGVRITARIVTAHQLADVVTTDVSFQSEAQSI